MNKVIIFDLGQVLVNVAFADFVEKFASEFDIEASEIMKIRENGAHIDFMKGTISGEEFHQVTCDYFNHFIPIEKFKSLWLQILDGQIAETAEIVSELCQKGYNLALLSNIDQWHYEYCERTYPIMKKFEKKFLSFRLRMKKPDEEIFIKVANELNTKPENCLLIDDKIENILAAKQVGFTAIHFVNAAQLKQDIKTQLND